MVLLVVHEAHDGSHDILHGRLQLCMAPRPHCMQGEGLRDAPRGREFSCLLLIIHIGGGLNIYPKLPALYTLQGVRDRLSSSASLKTGWPST